MRIVAMSYCMSFEIVRNSFIQYIERWDFIYKSYYTIIYVFLCKIIDKRRSQEYIPIYIIFSKILILQKETNTL